MKCTPRCRCDRHISRICLKGCGCGKHSADKSYYTIEFRTKLGISISKGISPAERKKRSQRAKEQHRQGNLGIRPHALTKLDCALYRLLHQAGYKVVRQKHIKSFAVDAYVPRYRLVFEADGSYWHEKGSKKERKRDRSILKTKVRAVIHLDENDLAPFLPTKREWESYPESNQKLPFWSKRRRAIQKERFAKMREEGVLKPVLWSEERKKKFSATIKRRHKEGCYDSHKRGT